MQIERITLKLGEVAEEYERVHYVHHYVRNTKLTKENLLPYAGKIADQIYVETGYMAFVRDIKVKHLALTTDVDFIIDSPAGSPIAPLVIIGVLKAIALVIAAIAILGLVIRLFTTVWSEKFKEYICDQCPDYPAFTGWKMYLAHLAEFHPTKYEAVKDEKDWWVKPVVAVGGLLFFLFVLLFWLRRRD